MGTEKADIHTLGILSTTTSPIAYDGTEQWNGSISNLSFLFPSQSSFSHSGYSILHGPLTKPSQATAHSDCIGPRQSGSSHTIVECTSAQETRTPSVLLEARWASPPSFASQCAASESLASPLTANLGPDGSQLLLDGSHSFMHSELITFSRGPGSDTASKLQFIPYMQSVPGPSPEFVGSTRCQQGNLGANLGHASFTGGTLMSSGTIKNTTNIMSDDKELPIVIYRAPEKKGLGQHSKRTQACVIDVGGVRIDRDDLCYGARRNDSLINVHECRWATSTDPCRMWIVGCNSRISAHIRKWHVGQNHTDTKRTAKCLWGGCVKTMLKDSIQRHIVTTHLDEALDCKGCHQRFSRKDVYNKHLEDRESCVGAGVTVVYGTPYMEIDACQVLHSEGQSFTRVDRV